MPSLSKWVRAKSIMSPKVGEPHTICPSTTNSTFLVSPTIVDDDRSDTLSCTSTLVSSTSSFAEMMDEDNMAWGTPKKPRRT